MSNTAYDPSQTESSKASTDANQVVDLDKEGIENEGEDDKVISSKASRKLTSKVWEEMCRFTSASGAVIAQCKWCKKQLSGSSSSGTTHLKKHLDNCVNRKYKKSGQLILQVKKNASSGSVEVQNYKFDQEKSRRDLARAIIKHNYPFNICEHEWFEVFCNGLNPNFKLVSRNTIRSDVIALHKEEKEKLYKFLDNLDCKVTLTTDIWTSDHSNIAYTCLTAHFIDDNWELRKTIIAYKYIPYPHDGETLFRFINELVLEWNLDRKLFSMVVDNASSNDSMVRHLRSWLLDKSWLPLGGDLFHVRCSAHILNLIVQDGLNEIGDILRKIRETCKYLKRSPHGCQKFECEECCLVLGIAVVLDPRFKMDLVEFYYKAIHGVCADIYVERVRNAFKNLFIEYGGQVRFGNCDEGSPSANRSKENTSEDGLDAFDQWYKESRSSTLHAFQKSEIDQYLEEPVFPRNESFNILEWWKANSPRYPTIGKMARDILAVPATTVASESAFSVGGRVIDESRASLIPEVVEALITTSDWIESRKKRKLVEVDDDDTEKLSLEKVARIN